MRVGIAVFAYNRDWHLAKVLKGLRENEEVDKIYVFQDGLKSEEHRNKWESVKVLIENIDWCKVRYFPAQENKGLARSIVDGVNYVLQENDAIIVLEDDCVPSSNFISFMQQCFEKYKEDKSVYSISGYAWPVDLEKQMFDVYFTGRISSWGWGTWKDRWEYYKTDISVLDRIRSDKESSLYLAAWGNDLEGMLIDRINGKNDSWAVYWALKVIEQKGVCVAPYVSFIQNIGFDGTGVNCGKTESFTVSLENDGRRKYILPDDISIWDNTIKALTSLFGNYTALNKDTSKPHVLIYGAGNFFKKNEKYINDKYYIEAFIDASKEGYLAGRKIIKASEINTYDCDKVIIMIQSIQECLKIAKELTSKYGVSHKDISFGIEIVSNENGGVVCYTEDDKLRIEFGGIKCKVGSLDEYNNAWETLVNKVYCYSINNQKEDIIIDIGMNIGDAVLYFLHQIKTRKVYGYEPFCKTYLSAEDNLKEYIGHTDRLEIFQFGLSNRNEQRQIVYNSEMSCGQSTLEKFAAKARGFYEQNGLVTAANDFLETIEVRRASEVLRPIIERHIEENLVLKMDCEGDEYGIMEDLFQEGLLGKFKFIMLEWHYNGNEVLLEYLNKSGFSYWCNDENKNMGVIYAYK